MTHTPCYDSDRIALHLMALPAVVVYGMLCSTKLSMIKLERIAI